MPAPIDPMRSLSEIMYLGTQFDRSAEDREVRRRQKRLETAFNTSKGDPVKAAAALESQGDYVTARTLRDQATAKREQTLDQVHQRLAQVGGLYGQGEQFLLETRRRPDLYPDLRPKLVEIAGQIDPRLAQGVPETYDETSVAQMLEFVTATKSTLDGRAKAIARLKEANTLADNAVERRTKQREALAGWLATVGSEEEWNQTITAAPQFGIGADVVEEFGSWSPDAQKKANRVLMTPQQRAEADKTTRPTNIESALLEPSLTPARKAELLALQRSLSDARRDPDQTTAANPQSVQAVLNTPSIWGDLTPSLRAAMLPALSRAGFDFGAAARNLSRAERATIERWRAGEIGKINADELMSDEQKAAERTRVEQSYRVQIGADETPSPRSAREAPWAPPRTHRVGPTPAADVPSPVSSLLANEPAGRYTLTDDSVWEKGADGTIRRVQ